MTQEKGYLDLADRVEAAKAGDRALDVAIARACADLGAWKTQSDERLAATIAVVRAYTASLDAAMTLVPEGWRLGGFAQHRDGTWEATLVGPAHLSEEDAWQSSQAASGPLALTAACLRAHASRVGDGREG